LNKGVLLKIFIGRGGLRSPPQPKPFQERTVIRIGEDVALYNVKSKRYIHMCDLKNNLPYSATEVKRLPEEYVNEKPLENWRSWERFRIVDAGNEKIGLWSVAQRCFIRVDANTKINGLNGVKGKLNNEGVFEWNPNEGLSPDEIFTVIPCESAQFANFPFSTATATIPGIALFNEHHQMFISCPSYSSTDWLSLKAEARHPSNIKDIIDSVQFEIHSHPIQFTAIHGRCGGDTIITDISQSILLRAQGGNGGCASLPQNKKINFGVGGGMKSSYNKKYVLDVIIYPGGNGKY